MKLVRSLLLSTTIGALITRLGSALLAANGAAAGRCASTLRNTAVVVDRPTPEDAASIRSPPPSSRLGVALSPGGLLLPYHVGVLDALQYHDVLDAATPVAGSSAGAIATAAHGCGIDSRRVLEATIDISDRTHAMGGARGRLRPLLQEKLTELIGTEQWERLLDREGTVGIAFKEIFPVQRNILQTSFEDADDLIHAVCHSSAFPFFTTNFPFALAPRKGGLLPRLVCDGFFTVPRARFGCPDFQHADIDVARTIMVSVFPRDAIGLDACHPDDCISPEVQNGDEMQKLLRLATQSSSRKELTDVYESGWADAERWCRAQTSSDVR